MNETKTSKLGFRCAHCWEMIPPGSPYRVGDRGKVHDPACPPQEKKHRFRVDYRVGDHWRRLPSQPANQEKALADAQRLLTRPAPVDQVRVTRYPGRSVVFDCTQEEWSHD